ncbi:MAG: MBOAT family protein, partial [Deltaproteobacteria bacterium]
YFYAFQIYCDFSGYTDIALGCARLLGYDLGVNFDRPYFSKTFSEFWTRWHISLSSWLRDYLYIPLGGNRGGAVETYRNLALTMLLGGLWHGANWTFVAWGGLHGAYLVVERLVERPVGRLAAALRLPPAVRSFLAVVLVFHLTAFAWIFFRAPSFGTAWAVIAGIATRTTLSLAQVQSKFLIAKGAVLCVVLMAAESLSFRPAFGERFGASPALRYATAAGIVWSLALFGAFSGSNFIYFQF